MTKAQKILTALLAGQIVVAAIMFWPRAETVDLAGPLFPDLTAEQVTSLVLEDGTGNRLVLGRDGAQWSLPEAGDFPVDRAKVEALLEKVVAVEANRLVARNKSSHKRLGVAGDDFESRITMINAAGEETVLLIGSSPNFRTAHVRRADDNVVYQSDAVTRYDAGAMTSAWIDTTYFTNERGSISGITIRNGNGEFILRKDEGGMWNYEQMSADEEFNQGFVDSLLGRVSSFPLLSPLGTERRDEYGLSNSQATVELVIEAEDGTVSSGLLEIGAHDADLNSYVVKWSESPYFVTAAAYSVSSVIEATHDDFIAQAEQPAE